MHSKWEAGSGFSFSLILAWLRVPRNSVCSLGVVST
jgi:hypothetical protein